MSHDDLALLAKTDTFISKFESLIPVYLLIVNDLKNVQFGHSMTFSL